MLGHKHYCPECGGILDLIQEESDDVAPNITYYFECRNCSKKSKTFTEADLQAVNAHDDPEKAKEALDRIMGKE